MAKMAKWAARVDVCPRFPKSTSLPCEAMKYTTLAKQKTQTVIVELKIDKMVNRAAGA